MSIHPSLRGASKGAKQRSVLKRIERIKDLFEKGLWKEGRSVFGLPKTKIVRVKIKKEKAAAEKPEAAAAEGAAAAPAAGVEAPKKETKKESKKE